MRHRRSSLADIAKPKLPELNCAILTRKTSTERRICPSCNRSNFPYTLLFPLHVPEVSERGKFLLCGLLVNANEIDEPNKKFQTRLKAEDNVLLRYINWFVCNIEWQMRLVMHYSLILNLLSCFIFLFSYYWNILNWWTFLKIFRFPLIKRNLCHF